MGSDTTKNILDQFDEVKIEQDLPITAADKRYCETLEKNYFEKLEELEGIEKKLQEAKNEMGEHPYLYEERWSSGNHSISYNFDKRRTATEANPFDKFKFTFLYDLLWLRNAKESIKLIFVDNIINYFDSTYNLKISLVTCRFFSDDNSDKTPNYKEVVEAIVKEYDGQDFTEIGIERVKEFFRSRVGYYERVKVTNDKLTMEEFFWSGDETSWSWGDSALSSLLDGLNLFEEKEISNINYFKVRGLIGGEAKIMGQNIDIGSSSYINSIKLFKNGRVDIRFKSKSLPKKFIDYFQLDRLQQNRNGY